MQLRATHECLFTPRNRAGERLDGKLGAFIDIADHSLTLKSCESRRWCDLLNSTVEPSSSISVVDWHFSCMEST